MLYSSPLVVLLASIDYVQAVRFLGRVNPDTRELTWPGTGVSFTFTGSSASIGIEAVSGTNSAELTVDGQATVITEVNGTSITTPAGLSNGNHTVELRKRSEATYGIITIGNVTTDGTLGPDVYSDRKIQVIGDSITVGYGLDGELPCVNSAALENNPKTYAALAADDLNADIDVIAWSGIGIVRNYASTDDTGDIMPQRWTRYGAFDPLNSYTFPANDTPDAVVINLGTNDFGYGDNIRPKLNPADYTAGMVNFVKTLKSHYPDAAYFLLTSPMLNDGWPSAEEAQKTTQTNALNAAIEQLKNSTNIQLVDMPSQGSDVGCDYHPNAATHAEEAKILSAALAKELGW
jgi:lysophospholipase L1-like esterase